MQDEDGDEGEFEMYRVQGTLREWVTRDEVCRLGRDRSFFMGKLSFRLINL